jgi:hypothetical protein
VERRKDGTIVLMDNRKPERWLSFNGSVYRFHFQFGPVVICWFGKRYR